MNTNYNYSQYYMLQGRFNVAMKLRCYRTARARLREMASIQNRMNPGVPTMIHYDRLISNYPDY